MPIHDWSRVRLGKFHHFHNAWIYKVSACLNAGLLPPAFYAACEQVSGEIEPDVVALQQQAADDSGHWHGHGGVLTVTQQTPQVGIVMDSAQSRYVRKQDHIAIREPDGDRLVAMIEIVSHGNKASRSEIERFLRKMAAVLNRGCHLLVVDLQPPAAFDPEGIHGAIWEYLYGSRPAAPANRPLTLAAYQAGVTTTAYVEPVAVGMRLRDMPLFLAAGWYVNVPLEETYQQAWSELPEPWRAELTG